MAASELCRHLQRKLQNFLEQLFLNTFLKKLVTEVNSLGTLSLLLCIFNRNFRLPPVTRKCAGDEVKSKYFSIFLFMVQYSGKI